MNEQRRQSISEENVSYSRVWELLFITQKEENKRERKRERNKSERKRERKKDTSGVHEATEPTPHIRIKIAILKTLMFILKLKKKKKSSLSRRVKFD